MQDLKALEGKSLVELREIAKAIGIGDTTLKKRELIEKIAGFSASEGAPAENKEKRNDAPVEVVCRRFFRYVGVKTLDNREFMLQLFITQKL